MNEEIITWARANKKRLVKSYLSSREFESHKTPAVIFMAGVPGAGKTEFARRLIPQLVNEPIHIDMDEIATHFDMYRPKIAHLFRAGATIILERLYEQALKQKIDILMDGTLSHPKSVQNIERALKNDYSVRIYFISPNPLTAWQKTKEREYVEERAIDTKGFVETYFKLLENLENIQKTFGNKVPMSLVIKDDDNRLKEIIEEVKDINNFTKTTLTPKELLDTISIHE